MLDTKPVNTPMSVHFKLKFVSHDISDDKMEYMENILYANIMGSLMHIMIDSRPNIAYAINLVSRFMGKPTKNHSNATKWLFR